VHKRSILAVKRVTSVSDRMSYIIRRGRWCRIIVLNVHTPTDDMKDSFYEEQVNVFYKFPKYHFSYHIRQKSTFAIFFPVKANECKQSRALVTIVTSGHFLPAKRLLAFYEGLILLYGDMSSYFS
jgi:hypothetical protein